MNIYLISQGSNTGYDTYDSAVVVATDIAEAQRIHPCSIHTEQVRYSDDDGSWATAEEVTAKLIGTTDLYTEPCVICASFNAG